MEPPKKHHTGLALILGFAPSAVFLAVAGLRGGRISSAVLFGFAGGALVCSFIASVLLFRRRTGWAIAGGICLLLINLVVSLFCGCVAVIQGIH